MSRLCGRCSNQRVCAHGTVCEDKAILAVQRIRAAVERLQQHWEQPRQREQAQGLHGGNYIYTPWRWTVK